MTLNPVHSKFKALGNASSVGKRDPLPSLPFYTPFTTYPGNASQGWRGGELAQSRKYRPNNNLQGSEQSLLPSEMIEDNIRNVDLGLKQLHKMKIHNRTNISWARQTPLPDQKRAVKQYANCIFPIRGRPRVMEHYYKHGVPEFSLERIPRNGPHTCSILGDEWIPHNINSYFTIHFHEIPVSERVFVGLIQDTPNLDSKKHLSAHNPLLFWTNLRNSKIDGCGIDLHRLPNGMIRVTQHHVPFREENHYTGKTIQIKEQFIADIPPPKCFSPIKGFSYEYEDRIAAVGEGLEAIAPYRKKLDENKMTQYTIHTRSLPNIIDTSPKDMLLTDGPLEIKVHINRPEKKERSIQYHHMNVTFTIGDCEVKIEHGVGPIWSPLEGKKRYFPCIGLSKGCTTAIRSTDDESLSSSDVNWNENRRAFIQCHLQAPTGLIHDHSLIKRDDGNHPWSPNDNGKVLDEPNQYVKDFPKGLDDE